ncbi:MAG: class I SAM-dependent methyltransferase [Syntrophomonas sp.]
MKLPLRLLTIADMIVKGESVADIGSDHALLCTYLVENGLASRAIASEIADGPYRRTQVAVAGSKNQEKIAVRQGNGLQTLQPGEVTNVVIAGMGADNIVNILADDWSKSRTFSRYVFQPMTKIQVLRSFLASRGWPILDERVVQENGHYFVLIASSPGNYPYILNNLETEIGPQVLTADTELKKEFIKKYRNKYTIIVDNLVHSGKQENIYAAGKYRQMIEQLEVILGERHS